MRAQTCSAGPSGERVWGLDDRASAPSVCAKRLRQASAPLDPRIRGRHEHFYGHVDPCDAGEHCEQKVVGFHHCEPGACFERRDRVFQTRPQVCRLCDNPAKKSAGRDAGASLPEEIAAVETRAVGSSEGPAAANSAHSWFSGADLRRSKPARTCSPSEQGAVAISWLPGLQAGACCDP